MFKCRIVNIIRKRPGNAVPVSRSFNVQPNLQITVPFRGPGRSRIISERACKGDPGAPINLADPNPRKKKAPEKCIGMQQTSSGGITLVNKCKACKAALIERQNRTGEMANAMPTRSLRNRRSRYYPKAPPKSRYWPRSIVPNPRSCLPGPHFKRHFDINLSDRGARWRRRPIDMGRK